MPGPLLQPPSTPGPLDALGTVGVAAQPINFVNQLQLINIQGVGRHRRRAARHRCALCAVPAPTTCDPTAHHQGRDAYHASAYNERPNRHDGLPNGQGQGQPKGQGQAPRQQMQRSVPHLHPAFPNLCPVEPRALQQGKAGCAKKSGANCKAERGNGNCKGRDRARSGERQQRVEHIGGVHAQRLHGHGSSEKEEGKGREAGHRANRLKSVHRQPHAHRSSRGAGCNSGSLVCVCMCRLLLLLICVNLNL